MTTEATEDFPGLILHRSGVEYVDNALQVLQLLDQLGHLGDTLLREVLLLRRTRERQLRLQLLSTYRPEEPEPPEEPPDPEPVVVNLQEASTQTNSTPMGAIGDPLPGCLPCGTMPFYGPTIADCLRSST